MKRAKSVRPGSRPAVRASGSRRQAAPWNRDSREPDDRPMHNWKGDKSTPGYDPPNTGGVTPSTSDGKVGLHDLVEWDGQKGVVIEIIPSESGDPYDEEMAVVKMFDGLTMDAGVGALKKIGRRRVAIRKRAFSIGERVNVDGRGSGVIQDTYEGYVEVEYDDGSVEEYKSDDSRITASSGARASARRVSFRKRAVGDASEPAKMKFENFATLMGLQTGLDLLEGDPDNPPDMIGKAGDPIKPTSDQNRPSANEIVKKAPEYENAEKPEVDKVPHEREKVKQTTSGTGVRAQLEQRRAEVRARRQAAAKQPVEQLEPAMDPGEPMERFVVGMKIAELRVEAKLIRDEEKHDYAAKVAQQYDKAQLEEKLTEHQELFTASKVASVRPTDGFVPPRLGSARPTPSDSAISMDAAVFGA